MATREWEEGARDGRLKRPPDKPPAASRQREIQTVLTNMHVRAPAATDFCERKERRETGCRRLQMNSRVNHMLLQQINHSQRLIQRGTNSWLGIRRGFKGSYRGLRGERRALLRKKQSAFQKAE